MITLNQTPSAEKLPTNMLEMQLYWEKKRQQQQWADARKISDTTEQRKKYSGRKGYFSQERVAILSAIQEYFRANNITSLHRNDYIQLYMHYAAKQYENSRGNAATNLLQDINRKIIVIRDDNILDMHVFLPLNFHGNIQEQLKNMNHGYV